MLLICNPGMRDRHWEEIKASTGLNIPMDEQPTVSTMMEIGLHHYTKDIEETCVSASKEFGLQIAMNKMEGENNVNMNMCYVECVVIIVIQILIQILILISN